MVLHVSLFLLCCSRFCFTFELAFCYQQCLRHLLLISESLRQRPNDTNSHITTFLNILTNINRMIVSISLGIFLYLSRFYYIFFYSQWIFNLQILEMLVFNLWPYHLQGRAYSDHHWPLNSSHPAIYSIQISKILIRHLIQTVRVTKNTQIHWGVCF